MDHPKDHSTLFGRLDFPGECIPPKPRYFQLPKQKWYEFLCFPGDVSFPGGFFFCFPKTNKQKPTGGKSKSVPSAHTRQVQYKLQGFYRFVQHWQGNLDEKTPWDEKTWGGSEGRGLLRSPGMWWFVAPDSVILFLGGGRELRS